MAIECVAAGDAWLDPAITTRVLASYRIATDPDAVAELERLTERELDVLRVVGRGAPPTPRSPTSSS
ncbi:MAG: hypothetical protein AAGA42_11060 [Actinomycetota bacterium]